MNLDSKTVAETAAQDSDSHETGIHGTVLAKQGYIFKMDLRLMPILGCTYTILFLDRTNSGLLLSIIELETDAS